MVIWSDSGRRVESGHSPGFEARHSRARHSAPINHGLPHCSPVNHAGLSGAGREAQREMKPIRLCQDGVSLLRELLAASLYTPRWK
jgi:hypothetical protein